MPDDAIRQNGDSSWQLYFCPVHLLFEPLSMVIRREKQYRHFWRDVYSAHRSDRNGIRCSPDRVWQHLLSTQLLL